MNEMSLINFDQNFNIKDTNINNTKCYISSEMKDSSCYSVGSSHFLYLKYFDKYALLKTCNTNNGYVLKIVNIPETCNNVIEVTSLNCDNNCYNENSDLITSISSSTIPNTLIVNSVDSTSLSVSSYLFLPPTSSIIQSNNDIIQLYGNGDLIKGKININKEELENNMEYIMKIINIGQKYEIHGEDYDIKITPINDQDSVKSSFLDLTICEEILKKKYNISSDEILTILKIEIDKKNDKALTNQIEYAIYNENKIKLNLSYCKN